MNEQNARYKMEYEWIPEYVYSERGADFVYTALLKKQELFAEIYKLCSKDLGESSIYEAEDFKVDATIIGNIAGILRVMMPPVCKAGDMIRLYFCHDAEFQNVRLYSIIIDADGDTCFLTWIDDSHYKNHGKFRLSEGEEIQTVQTFYIEYLGSIQNG